MKTALQIAKNRTAKYSKAKEHARAQKPNKWMGPRPANCSEDNPLRKELDESWPTKRAWKGRTEKRERSPTHLNRTVQHRARTERIVATEKKGEEKKHSNAKDPSNSAKNNAVTKDKQLVGRPQQMSLKVVLIRENSYTKY